MNSMKFQRDLHFLASLKVVLYSFQNTLAFDIADQFLNPQNYLENVLFLSIHVESLAALINGFWQFSMFSKLKIQEIGL